MERKWNTHIQKLLGQEMQRLSGNDRNKIEFE